MRLLPLAGPGVEGAEPQVAMRLQRAHAEFLGQGEGLAVVGGGLVDVRGLAMHGDLAEEPAGMRLVAAARVGTGEFEEASGQRTRLVHAADEEQGLAQLGEHERMEDQRLPVATRSSIWSKVVRDVARPARAYAALKREAVMGKNAGCWRSGRAPGSVRARGSPCGRPLGGGRANQHEYSAPAIL